MPLSVRPSTASSCARPSSARIRSAIAPGLPPPARPRSARTLPAQISQCASQASSSCSRSNASTGPLLVQMLPSQCSSQASSSRSRSNASTGSGRGLLRSAREVEREFEALLEARRPQPLALRRDANDRANPRYFEVGRFSCEARDQAAARRKDYARNVHSIMRERRQRDAAGAVALQVAALEEVAAEATAAAHFSCEGACLTLLFSSSTGTCEPTSYEQVLQMWDWASQQRVRSMPELVSQCPLLSVAKSPDGLQLASGTADGSVNIYCAATATHSRQLHSRMHAAHSVLCVAFSPDGERLASGGPTGLVTVWDVESGECVQTWSAHEGCVLSMAFTSDGHLLATGGQDRSVAIWLWRPSASILEKGRVTGLPGAVLSLRFNHDGRRVYTGTHAGRVEVRQRDHVGASRIPLA